MRTKASLCLPGSANSPGGVTQVAVHCRLSDSVGLGWGPRMLCCQQVPRRGCCCWLGTHFENLWFRTCQKEGVFRLWVLGCEAGLLDLILWAAESYWWDGGTGHGLICISKRSFWCSVGEWIWGTGTEAGR